MPRPRTLARLVGAALAFVAYVWVAAVRNAGLVKRRKRLRHARR
jgi:hypothetical protein